MLRDEQNRKRILRDNVKQKIIDKGHSEQEAEHILVSLEKYCELIIEEIKQNPNE